jgi:hypothetical protein
MYIELSCPARVAKPVLDQPPKLENSVKTLSALAFGAFTKMGTMTAKNASTCRMKKSVWTRGIYLDKRMFAVICSANTVSSGQR